MSQSIENGPAIIEDVRRSAERVLSFLANLPYHSHEQQKEIREVSKLLVTWAMVFVFLGSLWEFAVDQNDSAHDSIKIDWVGDSGFPERTFIVLILNENRGFGF